MNLHSIDRNELLEGLSQIAGLMGKSEALSQDDLLSMTLPIPAHLNTLEPDILLIIGGRGAGKTHLFRLVNLPNGPQILGYQGRSTEAFWIPGFATPRSLPDRPVDFPGETVLQRFSQTKSRTELMDFWRGLLIGSLLNTQPVCEFLSSQLPTGLITPFQELAKVSTWHSHLIENLETADSALNRLDKYLVEQNRYLFVTYDDLDVMAVEWEEKRTLIQALLQFWLGQWRRWQRIRPKIFLRRDLFSEEFLNFPDASKFSGHRFDLIWTPLQLYQLVFKLWANQGLECRKYLEAAGLQFVQHPALGWIYQSPWPTEATLRQVIIQMMGQFMGSGPNKGRTFEWPTNHLQDANKEIVPRSVLNLFALAAQDELTNHRATPPLLLSPTSFADAISKVSNLRIRELVEEEYPWLAALRGPLDGQTLPMVPEKFLQLLRSIDWKVMPKRPPDTEPKKLLEHLLALGVIRQTVDKRIHVPDIYLHGFNLKRKGGIRRPGGKSS